jgi:hypothetical protein
MNTWKPYELIIEHIVDNRQESFYFDTPDEIRKFLMDNVGTYRIVVILKRENVTDDFAFWNY